MSLQLDSVFAASKLFLRKLKFLIACAIGVVAAPLYLFLASVLALYVRNRPRSDQKPRVVFGPIPIINNHYWSIAMRNAGYESETYTFDYYSKINKREDWGRILSEEYGKLPTLFKFGIAFLDSLIKYDVFVIPFSGYFLGSTPLWCFESLLFKISRKKTIVIPYGSDAFVYRNISSPLLAHGLMMSYPQAARRQDQIERRVKHWVRHADFTFTSWIAPDGPGRWDVLSVSPLCLDISQWKESTREQRANGEDETVYIAHAPNHRGFKGTEFIIEAINSLKSDGIKVELVLLENIQNKEVRAALESKVDILVDQLVFTGYSMNTIEGMACGVPTICNLEDPTYTTLMRRWSYLGECPLVSSSPENIKQTLKQLIHNPALRKTLGAAGRRYAEKHHSLDAAQFLFTNIIEYLYERRGSLINLYHPLLGEYMKDQPRIVAPHINKEGAV